MKKLYFALFVLILAASATHAQIPVITIDSARANDANGVPLLDSTRVQVAGTVYGPNQYPTTNGVSFILHNGSMGIKVYAKHTYNYTVTDGDSVVVVGYITQYKGAEEISPDKTVATDTIYKVGTGNLLAPVVVVNIGESNEDELIQINNVDMTNATGWTPASHYFTATASGYSIYIDSFMSAALFNMAQPQGIYNIVGFGAQFKSSAPYTSGYQIQPRSPSDFHLVSGINSISNSGVEAKIYPNPSNGSFIMNISDNTITAAEVNIYDLTGRLAYSAKQTANNGKLNVTANELTTGIYLVEVKSGNQLFRSKITVQQ
ncbi:MAG TPA: T9SS type A sorting domain-containing protein [Chitinophagales bacterium]|nr:T9SS type A sorting domain-containing protein [Chitinophagales bacterium]